jgi:hypothetical protein
MNYPAAELRDIWNTEYSSQKSEVRIFFEDILIPLLDSYPEAEFRGILLIIIIHILLCVLRDLCVKMSFLYG